MADGRLTFAALDYMVCGLSIVLSLAIGLFYVYRDGRERTIESYLMADRKMSALPVALSYFMTMLSGIAFLSDPVEVYNYGQAYIGTAIAALLNCLTIGHLIAPVYNKLRLTSTYEYLEMRYSSSIRIVISSGSGVFTVLFIGLNLFATALAFNQVSGVNIYLSIIVIGIVTSIYTSAGGMRSVVWVDSIQTLIAFAGVIVLLVRSVTLAGGISAVLEKNREGDRDNMLAFGAGVRSRSILAYVIGGYFRMLSPSMSCQYMTQRYTLVTSPRNATKALYLASIPYVMMYALLGCIGMAMFALYGQCDPLQTGSVTRRDQMIPHMVMDVLHDLPGMAGLYMASIFTALLSTLSSAQNAMATNLLTDFLQPAYYKLRKKTLSDKTMTRVAIATAYTTGLLFIAVGCLFSVAGSSLFLLVSVIAGVSTGPASVLFLLGIYMPNLKTKNVVVGVLSGMLLTSSMFVGAFINWSTPQPLKLSTENCDVNTLNVTFSADHHANATTHQIYALSQTLSNGTSLEEESELPPWYFNLPGIWYPAVGFITACTVTLILWLVTDEIPRLIKGQKHEKVCDIQHIGLQAKQQPPEINCDTKLPMLPIVHVFSNGMSPEKTKKSSCYTAVDILNS